MGLSAFDKRSGKSVNRDLGDENLTADFYLKYHIKFRPLLIKHSILNFFSKYG